ncbi:Panacea domain-containing protein [Macellibacteroides fermentans]|uniref:Panacea domain-containing protein n=1 Tax=Macellibacteroides fermentans TaxID=879969 RepID=UPI003B938E3C
MSKLTSLDYADLINWIAYNKYGVLLNKTQMQKILYICYGVFLAENGNRLFEDDSPKAWPFGPVFPRVNKRFVPEVPPSSFNKEKEEEFLSQKEALRVVFDTVKKFHKYSAKTLSEWSHLPEGPWSKTIYGEDGSKKEIQWNQVIPDELIADYFSKSSR